MIKYTPEAMKKMDEIVRCEHCGKQIRRGQSIVGFREIVCRECAMKTDKENCRFCRTKNRRRC